MASLDGLTSTPQISEAPKVAENPPHSENQASDGAFLWTVGPGLIPTSKPPHPLSYQEKSERLLRLSRQLLRRASVAATPSEVESLERKIRRCQAWRERAVAYPATYPQRIKKMHRPLPFLRAKWSARIGGRLVNFILDRPTMLIIAVADPLATAKYLLRQRLLEEAKEPDPGPL